MASHFSSIGVNITSAQALETLAERVIRGRACTIYGTSAGRYFRWRCESGAEIWLQADRRRRLMGANPHYAGPGQICVGLVSRIHRAEESELDGAFLGWVAPEDPTRPMSGLYPLVFDLPDAGRHLGLPLPRTEMVQMAAFVHRIRLWPARAVGDPGGTLPTGREHSGEVDGGGGGSPPAMAVIPRDVDAHGEAAPNAGAEVLVTGVLRQVERRENALTGDVFWWLHVETLGGSCDLVADPDLVSVPPLPGDVVQASAWLSGRLIAHDSPRRSLWRRLMGRPAGR